MSERIAAPARVFPLPPVRVSAASDWWRTSKGLVAIAPTKDDFTKSRRLSLSFLMARLDYLETANSSLPSHQRFRNCMEYSFVPRIRNTTCTTFPCSDERSLPFCSHSTSVSTKSPLMYTQSSRLYPSMDLPVSSKRPTWAKPVASVSIFSTRRLPAKTRGFVRTVPIRSYGASAATKPSIRWTTRYTALFVFGFQEEW